MTKLKIGLALGLLLDMVAGGVAMLTPRAVSAPTPQAEHPAEPPKAEDKAAVRVDRYGDPLPASALARLGTIRLRHACGVIGVAYSPDGKLLASLGTDECVCLWDAETGRELRQFRLRPQVRLGRNWAEGGIVFSPDGKLVAAGGPGLVLWDVASGKEVHRQEGNTRYVVFSPDSRTVVSGDYPNQGVRLLDLKSRKQRRLPPRYDTIHAVAFSPDGKLLAAAGPKDRVSLLDAATLKELRSWQGHPVQVSSLDFSADGKQLVTAGWDSTVRLWDAANGKEIRSFPSPDHRLGEFRGRHSLMGNRHRQGALPLTESG